MKKQYFTLLQLLSCLLPLFGQQTLVKDIFTGLGSSNPQNLVSYQNKIWFTASDGATQRIYSSDGTTAATQPLSIPMTGRSLMKSLIVHQNLLYFGVLHPAATGNQLELWQSNGITSRVVDTIHYSGNLIHLEMFVKNAKIYLHATYNNEKRLYVHTGVHGSSQFVTTLENGGLGAKSEVISGTNFHFVLTNRATTQFKEASIAIQEGSTAAKILWSDNIDLRKNESGTIQIRILNILNDELYYVLDKQKMVNSVLTKDIALYKITKTGVQTKLLALNQAADIAKTSVIDSGKILHFIHKEGIWVTTGSGTGVGLFIPGAETKQTRGFVELMQLNNQLYMLGGGTGTTANLYRRRGGYRADLVYIAAAGTTYHHFGVENGKIYFVVHQSNGCKGYALWTAPDVVQTVAEPVATFHQNPTFNCNGKYENQSLLTPTHFYYGFDDTQHGFELWRLKLIPATPIPDLALDITYVGTPLFFKNEVTTFKATVKNKGLTPYSQIKIRFQAPTGTATGGNAQVSLGTGMGTQRYSDSTYLYDWTIPTLAGGATATLTIPVQSVHTPAFATSHLTLQNAVPADENPSNNQPYITIKTAVRAPTPSDSLSKEPLTQQMPVVIRQIAPNPTKDRLMVQVESLKEEATVFDIYDSNGKKVLSKQISVQMGLNQFEFDLTPLSAGFYFMAPAANGVQSPTKFIKI